MINKRMYDYLQEIDDKKLEELALSFTKEEANIVKAGSSNYKHQLRIKQYVKNELRFGKYNGQEIHNRSLAGCIELRRLGCKIPYIEISLLMNELGLNISDRKTYYVPRMIQNAVETGHLEFSLNDEDFKYGPYLNGESLRLLKALEDTFNIDVEKLSPEQRELYNSIFNGTNHLEAHDILDCIISYTISNKDKYYGDKFDISFSEQRKK